MRLKEPILVFNVVVKHRIIEGYDDEELQCLAKLTQKCAENYYFFVILISKLGVQQNANGGLKFKSHLKHKEGSTE